MFKARENIGSLALVACFAVAALYVDTILRPVLVMDDFSLVVHALTWQATRESLWLPQNEHAMMPGRITTWLLVQLAGTPSAYPTVLAWQGPVALFVALGLFYRFIRRECDSPLIALIGLILFGVTSVYHQAVAWFSASFSVVALDMTLLALLAAQRWRQTGQTRHGLLCMFWTALAPAWFALGILAGPICCAYLWPTPAERKQQSALSSPGWKTFARTLLRHLCPMAGTLAFLAISLPFTAKRIVYAEHYGGESAFDAFNPFIGIFYTARALVDGLALGLLGASGVTCPIWVAVLVMSLLVWAVIRWWRPVPERRLLYLGLAFIFFSYVLMYSARSRWQYEDNLVMPRFTRYHLLPQAGLALLVCGGLPWHLKLTSSELASSTVTPRQNRVVLALIGILLIVQLPRALLRWAPYMPEQATALREIEEMDKCLHTYHIDAETARAVLGWAPMSYSCWQEDRWGLLRGSPDPRPITVEEARRVLAEERK